MKLILNKGQESNIVLDAVKDVIYYRVNGKDLQENDYSHLKSIVVTDDDGNVLETFNYPEVVDYRSMLNNYYLGFRITSESERQQAIDEFIDQFDKIPEIFPSWTPGVAYKTGNRVQYNGTIYKVLQPHTSQEDWKPDVAVSLFAPMNDQDEPEGTLNIYPEWKQPTGSTDCYATGAKVSHNGKKWVSLVEANVWEPSDVNSTLWKKEEEESTETETETIPEWKQPTGSTDCYAKGSKVTYQGKTFQSTVDANVWAPNVYGWAEVTE